MQKIKALYVTVFLALCTAVGAQDITIFAASSLREAVEDLAAEYEAQSGTGAILVFAASSAVARQVAQGAPADIALLVDQDWADWLVGQGRVAGSEPIAGNRLVIAGQRGQQPFSDPQRLVGALGRGVLAMAQVDAVPAGRYGQAALAYHNLWEQIDGQVVQAANVRAALRFVERGEAALGIGYSSDMVALPDLVTLYEFEPDSHPVILYSGAVITGAGDDFVSFVQSPKGQDILGRWGFLPAPAVP